jgi:protease I
MPGGCEPEYIRMFNEAKNIVIRFFEANKRFGVIFYLAQLLAVISDLMKGREYTAYPSVEPVVRACGATYINKKVHTQENLVAGQVWCIFPSQGNLLHAEVIEKPFAYYTP